MAWQPPPPTGYAQYYQAQQYPSDAAWGAGGYDGYQYQVPPEPADYYQQQQYYGPQPPPMMQQQYPSYQPQHMYEPPPQHYAPPPQQQQHQQQHFQPPLPQYEMYQPPVSLQCKQLEI